MLSIEVITGRGVRAKFPPPFSPLPKPVRGEAQERETDTPMRTPLREQSR
jgi:hypothetical protein